MKIQTRPRRPQYKNALKYTDKEEIGGVRVLKFKSFDHHKSKIRSKLEGGTRQNKLVKFQRVISTNEILGLTPRFDLLQWIFWLVAFCQKGFRLVFFFGLKCKKQLVDSCPPTTRKCRVHTKHKQHRKLEDLRIHTWALRPTYAWTGGLGKMHNIGW